MSDSLKLAVCVPVAVGLNVTLIEQLPPEFSVAGGAPQVELATVNSLLFVPVMLHERLVSAPEPVLKIVTDFVELVPRLTVP